MCDNRRVSAVSNTLAHNNFASRIQSCNKFYDYTPVLEREFAR